MKNLNQVSGDGGINIAGNGNIVNYSQTPIKYELLSKLCKGFINSDFNGNEDMNVIELPVELLEKIEYNNLNLHKELYEDFSTYLLDIEEVVDKTLGDDSIKLVRMIKHLYKETVANNKDYSNDQILFDMENRLMSYTDLINSKEYYNEDVQNAICQVVLYVFQKCQILKKPKIKE